MRYLILSAVVLFGLLSISERSFAEEKDKTGVANKTLKLATTTSVENTGLIYALVRPFEEKFNIKVDVIAVGSGKALE